MEVFWFLHFVLFCFQAKISAASLSFESQEVLLMTPGLPEIPQRDLAR